MVHRRHGSLLDRSGRARLTWESAPPGDANAPHQPTEAEGAWADESDLDWVIFSVAGGAPDAVVSDVGFNSAYPQEGGGRLAVRPGEPLAIAVGCHHEVPTAYTLSLDVRGR